MNFLMKNEMCNLANCRFIKRKAFILAHTQRSRSGATFEVHSLRQEAQSIVQDNENLLKKLDKFSAASNVDPDRYIFLAENAQIVVNENELLKVRQTFKRLLNLI